jgi:hypothetical protein
MPSRRMIGSTLRRSLAVPTDGLEKIAREHCARLLDSKAAKALPREQAEGLAIIAFTIGAAWGMDRPDMIELANAQFDSLRSDQQ